MGSNQTTLAVDVAAYVCREISARLPPTAIVEHGEPPEWCVGGNRMLQYAVDGAMREAEAERDHYIRHPQVKINAGALKDAVTALLAEGSPANQTIAFQLMKMTIDTLQEAGTMAMKYNENSPGRGVALVPASLRKARDRDRSG